MVVSLFGGLAGVGVDSRVVADFEPGGEGAIELVEGEQGAGSDFGFELALSGLEEALDEAAGGGVSRGTMPEADRNLVAGDLQALGMVDLGVVEIELKRGAMGGERSEPGRLLTP